MPNTTQAEYEYKTYDRAALRPLCWGLLLHMAGLTEESEKCFETLREIESDPESGTDLLAEIADSVSSYRDAGSPEARSEAHRSVVWALGRVLDPDGHGINPSHKPSSKDGPPTPRPDRPGRAKLSAECPRCDDPRGAYDSPANGYSRDPFKRIDPDHMPEIGFAAIAYLMRAHSFFFHRPREERDFNAAKVSLNDLFQATQMACRLYYSLEECHHTRHTSQDQYLQEVRKGPDPSGDPWLSPFFIWSVLHLVEVQRGNIYRQLQYLEEANRHYRHVQVRFRHLVGDPLAVDRDPIVPLEGRRASTDTWFMTPTFIRALVERSKVLFNRGLFIESMMCQLQSLALLARRSSPGRTLSVGTGNKKKALSRISRGLRFLDVVRRESVWDKNGIHRLFAGGSRDESPLAVLLTGQFLSYLGRLSSADRRLVADIYARIGLTLFILESRPQLGALPKYPDERLEGRGNPQEEHADLLKMVLMYKRLNVESPSAIVRDALMILDAPKERDPSSEGTESLDRSLTRNLGDTIRNTTHRDKGTHKRPRTERQFFTAVLEVATQHILNIVTIPRRVQNCLIRPGYKQRRRSGDLSGRTVAESVSPTLAQRAQQGNRAGTHPSLDDQHPEALAATNIQPKKEGKLTDKFVVLRRWQSFNPKIPRPHSHAIRGGGYFLMWGGKGVVIDPGYDFLQNFYDEGFSIADIDAVVVTHSHPDHEDDLSTLSTLVREWNEYHQHMGREEDAPLSLDLFLNESAHLKFSNWLKASDFGIGRIIPLPLVVWNLDSRDPGEELRGGRDNVRLPLREKYNFDLEVVPAWHDDVIGKTAAVGLKFHLFPRDGKQERAVGILGYTGDTGAYPWTEEAQPGDGPEEPEESRAREGQGTNKLRVEDHYGECDVLVAHLGDVRLRELFSLIDPPAKDPKLGVSIGNFLSSTFCRKSEVHVDPEKATKDRMGQFFKLLITLHLAPQRALDTILDSSSEPPLTVARALHNFCREGNFGQEALRGFACYREARKTLENLTAGHDRVQITDYAQKHLSEAAPADVQPRTPLEDWQIAYTLLGFLCAASASRWHYGYHLGITGLYRMQRALLDDYKEREKEGNPCRERVLVVGELPEELASYRHHIARLLNFTEGNFDEEKTDGPNRRVHAFTGDIGLHIGLGTEENEVHPSLAPRIRCTYCNYNNEIVLKPGNYHPPEKIFETPLKRLDSAMIYLCTEHDHHPEAEWRPPDFLSRPSLRVI